MQYLSKVAILLLILNFNTTSLIAQVPDHDKIFNIPAMSYEEWLDNWDENTDVEDINFYISRVRLKDRFININTQVNPNANPNRMVCKWQQLGESTKVWKAHPRYLFRADNFSAWSMIDFQPSWSCGFFDMPGGNIDVAHKNGVRTGGSYFMPWNKYLSEQLNWAIRARKFIEKDAQGNFKYLEQFIKILKYLGVEGLSWNGESHFQSYADDFQEFFRQLNVRAKEEGIKGFHIDWYGYQTDSGWASSQRELNANNDAWFRQGDQQISHMYFLDYGATNFSGSAAHAKSLGGNPYNVFAGIYQKKAGMDAYWTRIRDNEISIGIWGEHSGGNIYEMNERDRFGYSEQELMERFTRNVERMWYSGSRNVAAFPAIDDATTYLTEAGFSDFHGINSIAVAKSTITELPFISKFNLGNGQYFNVDGIRQSDQDWYNIGIQDYMPTWRWWVIDDNGNAPTDAIKADFTYDDAWFGGSCLKLHGATSKSNINLFKTQLDVTAADQIRIVFKMKSGDASKLKIRFCKEGSELLHTYIPVGDGAKGEWVTKTFTLGDYGVSSGDVIAMCGLTFENTSSDYELLLGEFAIVNPGKTYSPVKPQIMKSVVYNETFEKLDFKLIWDASAGQSQETHVYNEDVDTWYYELLLGEDGEEKILMTTTSWAGYVVNAQLNSEYEQYKIGVRSVAPDGITRSEIAWVMMDKNPQTDFGIQANKNPVLPNQEMTLSLADATVESAQWQIMSNPAITKEGQSITFSVADAGFYDVKVTIDGVEKVYPGYVNVIDNNTGDWPQADFEATKTDLQIDEQVILSSTGNDNALSISQGLSLSKQQFLTCPETYLDGNPTATVAFWLRITEFPTTQDVLFQDIRTTAYDLGLYINSKGKLLLRNNRLSDKYLQIAEEGAITKNEWIHIAFTADYNAQQVVCYINGKVAVQMNHEFLARSGGTLYFAQSLACDFDDIQIWHKVLTQSEIESTMQGDAVALAELRACWNFENGDLSNSSKFDGGQMLIENASEAIFCKGVYNYPGSEKEKISHTWYIEGEEIAGNTNVVTSFEQVGEYDVELEVENIHGENIVSRYDLLVVSDLGTNISSINLDLSVYPNPFAEHFTVRVSEIGNYSFKLFDLKGAQVFSREASLLAGEKLVIEAKVDSGLYVLQVEKDGIEHGTFKVFKID